MGPPSLRRDKVSRARRLAVVALLASALVPMTLDALSPDAPDPWDALTGVKPRTVAILALWGHVTPDGQGVDRVSALIGPAHDGAQVDLAAAHVAVGGTVGNTPWGVERAPVGSPHLRPAVRDTDGSIGAAHQLNQDDLAKVVMELSPGGMPPPSASFPGRGILPPGTAFHFDVRPKDAAWERVEAVVPTDLDPGRPVRFR